MPDATTKPGSQPSIPNVELRHEFVQLEDIRLHYVTAGEGPLLILLHGFPDFWYTWRRQIGPLSARFRVVAPDLRGYNESDKPEGVDAYHLRYIAADVIRLIQAVGCEKAFVVGHDWGGAVAWYLGAHFADRIERLAILNSPHPAAFFREMKTFAQFRRSWYMLFFQIPWLPEQLLAAGDYSLLRKVLRGGCRRPEAFTHEDLERYADAFARPRALTCALNYYRAAARGAKESAKSRSNVDVPTSVIWGEEDPALGKALTLGLERWVPDLRVEYVAGAGHWVHLEAPGRVNELLLGFFK